MVKIFHHGNWKKEKGVTVLEVVISLSIITIVSVAAVSIAISTSNSFNTISVKRFFQREIDNIAEIYLSYESEDFKTGFKDLTGKDITGSLDTTYSYYLDSTFNYIEDSSSYSYKLVLDFEYPSLSISAYKQDDSLLRSRSVSKWERLKVLL